MEKMYRYKFSVDAIFTYDEEEDDKNHGSLRDFAFELIQEDGSSLLQEELERGTEITEIHSLSELTSEELEQELIDDDGAYIGTVREYGEELFGKLQDPDYQLYLRLKEKFDE